MSKNIEDFRLSVRKNADERLDIILSNSGVAQAGIVLSNMFRVASKSVNIFANNLANDVCGQVEYLEELEKCINRIGNENVKFLLKNEPDGDSKAYSLLQSKNVKVVIAQNANAIFEKFTKEVNFTIADNSMFRLETDTRNYRALFSFKEETTSAFLNQIFNTNFNFVMNDGVVGTTSN